MIEDDAAVATVHHPASKKLESFIIEDEGAVATVHVQTKKPSMQDLIVQNEDLKNTIQVFLCIYFLTS